MCLNRALSREEIQKTTSKDLSQKTIIAWKIVYKGTRRAMYRRFSAPYVKGTTVKRNPQSPLRICARRGRSYECGIHSFLTRSSARRFLKISPFRENYEIIKVEVKQSSILAWGFDGGLVMEKRLPTIVSKACKVLT